MAQYRRHETRDLDLARVLKLVRGRGAVAQLCVLRDGPVVVDEAFGCDHRALFWIFSASEPFIALLVHLLAERGELALDDRVAAYWPGFARGGKEAVTIRQVLQHRSGLAGGMLGPRQVPISGRRPAGLLSQAFLNRPSTRAAVVPAAGISTTARDLAHFYLTLLRGGERGGVRILAPATIEEARRPSSDGETDRFVGLPIRWAQGFQLGGPGHDATASRPMGRLGSPETFGHNGSNACLAWPTRRGGWSWPI